MLLEIYVQEGCFGCRRSVEMAERARQSFPDLQVEVVDFNTAEGVFRSKVAATPTYILDGEIISLGNPSPAEFESLLAERSTRATR